MDKREQALKPLMYIEQPTETIPKSAMQQTYSSWNDQTATYDQPKKDEQTLDIEKEHSQMNTHHIVEGEPSEIEAVDNKEDEQTFANLTIEKKIMYCTSTSTYIPKITCVIKTENQTVVGIIEKYEEEIVHIRPHKSRKITEIPLEKINSIRLAGF